MENKIITCSLGNTTNLEEIRCINCGELSYLHENRESGKHEKCGYCGKSLHQTAAQSIDINFKMNTINTRDLSSALEKSRKERCDAFKVPPMYLAYTPLGKSVIGSAIKAEEKEVWKRKNIKLLSGTTDKHGKKLSDVTNKHSSIKDDFDKAMRESLEKILKRQEHELIHGTGEQEPIGFMSCEDLEPETEITELVDGNWVTRKG